MIENRLAALNRAPGLRLALGLALALALGIAACGEGPAADASISAAELARRIESGSAPLVLDVRTPGEYEAGHIPGSLNIPHDQLSERLNELGVPKTAEIVVHCQAGRRAGIAEGLLADAGYTQVRDLEGQMAGWREAGLPVE